jgi:hypothetical protein
MKFCLFSKILLVSTVLAGFALPASALKYKHVNATNQNGINMWLSHTSCLPGSVASNGVNVALWKEGTTCTPAVFNTVTDTAFGSGGFRFQLSGSNLCLNALSSTSYGTNITLYTCIAGDSGQVFTATPNPGQLKLKKVTNGKNGCIEPAFGAPIVGYPNGLQLLLQQCSTSGNQNFQEL